MSEARRADGFLARREAGVLLHPTSLPSGSMADAGRFLEFLARADCRVWQMLPLGPTGFQLSPYSPVSVFAGNVRLLPRDGRRGGAERDADVATFVEAERHWLPDYALFVALKNAAGGAAWWDWPPEARDRRPRALERLRRRHRKEIDAVLSRPARLQP